MCTLPGHLSDPSAVLLQLQHILNNTELVESSRWAKGPDENFILINRRWHLTVNASLDDLGFHQVDNGSERT